MLKPVNAAWLLTSLLVLSGCQSLPPAQPAPALQIKPVQIPPLPMETGPLVREPNLTDRLLRLLSPSPQMETRPSESETPASSNTTVSAIP